jgi:hypothetical protein
MAPSRKGKGSSKGKGKSSGTAGAMRQPEDKEQQQHTTAIVDIFKVVEQHGWLTKEGWSVCRQACLQCKGCREAVRTSSQIRSC